MMSKSPTQRDVIRMVLDGKRPPYVPWAFSFTLEALHKLQKHFADKDLEDVLENHIVILGNPVGFFDDVDATHVKDVFGVVWDRSIDKDIGNVEGCVIPEPMLRDYNFPDPHDPRCFAEIESSIARYPNRFRLFEIGFSLYERAWTLRGMEDLIMDFIENPDFVKEFLNDIADYNIAQVRKACEYDIDGICFGDDWGAQHGLLMGPPKWHEFIEPVLKRMYDEVHRHGKYVFIHSCGDVDELFDDLHRMGVNCFNPFQPEVMDVHELHTRYLARMAFHGGLSTQRTLPYGSVRDVKAETRSLIDMGRAGSYILAPAHAVEGDVSLENMLAFITTAQAQGPAELMKVFL